MKRILTLVAAFFLVAVAAPDAKAAYYDFGFSGGSAQTLTVDTTSGTVVLSTGTNEINPGINNQGWWSPNSGNTFGNDNYITGNDGALWNDFFSFDLSALAGLTVTGATLNVNSAEVFNDSGTTVPLRLGSVSIDASTLAQVDNNPNAAIYNALGSGTLYGNYTLSTSDFFVTENFGLNAAAVTDLQNAINNGDQFFSIGGTANAPAATPEPASLTLLGFGAAGLAGYALRRRRATRVAR